MHQIVDYLTTTLTPSDTDLGAVSQADWWVYVKPHFDDVLWQYYLDRVVFMNSKFPRDDDITTKNNIIRSFAINLKTKARMYEKLFEVIAADYNPLWNVDATIGTVRQSDHTGTDIMTHTGTDTSVASGSDKSTLGGTDTSSLSGRDIDTLSGSDTTAEDVTDTHVKTGNETLAATGDDVNTKKVATYDSEGNFLNSEQDTLSHGKTDTHSYNNVTDTHSLDSDKTLTYGKTDTMQYGKVDTMRYGKTDTMQYGRTDRITKNTTDGETKDLHDKDVELVMRSGNIGVTSSMDLVEQQTELWGNEIMDFVKRVVRDCVNTCTYGCTGI